MNILLSKISSKVVAHSILKIFYNHPNYLLVLKYDLLYCSMYNVIYPFLEPSIFLFIISKFFHDF